MVRVLRVLLLVLGCGLVCAGTAHAGSWTALFSEEAHDGGSNPFGASLGLIDLGASPLTGSSPFACPNPFDVVITPDASTAYVATSATAARARATSCSRST